MSQIVPNGVATTLEFCCVEYQGGAVEADTTSATLQVSGLYLLTLVLPFLAGSSPEQVVAGDVVITAELDATPVLTWRETLHATGYLTASPSTTFEAAPGAELLIRCTHDVTVDAVDSDVEFTDESQRTVTLLVAGPVTPAGCLEISGG